MFIFFVLGAFIGATAFIFFLQNLTTVTIMFLSWEIESPMAMVLAAAFSAGVAMTLLLSLPSIIADWIESLRVEKRIRELENQLYESKKREEEAIAVVDKVKMDPDPTSEHLIVTKQATW